MSTNLSFALVLATDGTIDTDASLSSAKKTLLTYVAERETESEQIGEAVHAVFDQYKGASINMPALQSMALTHLNVQPESFKVLGERVAQYVRDNADLPEVKDKAGNVTQAAEPARTRAFKISKGKNGGVRRWADHPVAGSTSAE